MATINRLTKTAKLYNTENDLPKPTRETVVGLINQRLADIVDLKTQIKQAHWNVKGPHFIGLHKLFDDIAQDVEEYMDLIAERAVQLGGVAEGTARVAANHSRLGEYPLTIGDGALHIEAVAKALSDFGHEVRMTINEVQTLEDAGTADLFTDGSRGIDTVSYTH